MGGGGGCTGSSLHRAVWFFRSWIDIDNPETPEPGTTLVTRTTEKLITIGNTYDLRAYPVDVQALEIALELKFDVGMRIIPMGMQSDLPV